MTAPDFSHYEDARDEWEQRTLELLRGMGLHATIGSGGLVSLDAPRPATAPQLAIARERLFSTDSSLYGRFVDYCDTHDIDPDIVEPATRPNFATQMHEFLAADADAEIAERRRVFSHVPEAIVPRGLVTNRLTYFYDKFGSDSGDSDKVHQHLREEAVRSYTGIADHFRGAFPEIRDTDLLAEGLTAHKHSEAATAVSELKTAYGMALRTISKGPAKRHAAPRPDRHYGIPDRARRR